MKIGNCGGDGGFVTYSLYPHKVGEYIIHEVERFRGEEIKRKNIKCVLNITNKGYEKWIS